ncbi:MAG: hypothetical protein WCC26_01275 [Terracidiphilus sp.]
MFAETYSVLINDLRFALEVMEDRSHLGLNHERAATLKALMERRISEAEQARGRKMTMVEYPRKKFPSA